MVVKKGYVEMCKKIEDLLDKFSPWACLIVSTCQFLQGSCVGGIGWLIAGVIWWLGVECESDLKKLIQMFKDHLADDKEKEDELTKNLSNPNLMDIDHMYIDHILEIGRDFQNSDKWHGATYDTAKLLCDTIEMLRNKVKNEEDK